MTLATETAAARGSKSSSAATKSAGKTAKASGKKVAASKSKNKSDSKSVLAVPLAPGPAPETPEADVALVKSAIAALRSSNATKATEIQANISDPTARKLVEWLILRNDHNGVQSKRYLAFIEANPHWPNRTFFRRRAEAMLWVENIKPAQALSFFEGSPPQSGMGRLVLARALLAQDDKERAGALIREAWRNDALSTDVEKQVLERYSEFLSRADHKARMEERLFAGDNEAGLRAARRLGAGDVAIAQARIATHKKAGKAKKLFDAVPADARCEPRIIF